MRYWPRWSCRRKGWNQWGQGWLSVCLLTAVACSSSVNRSSSPSTAVSGEPQRGVGVVTSQNDAPQSEGALSSVAPPPPVGFEYPVDLLPRLPLVLAPDTPAVPPLPRWTVAPRRPSASYMPSVVQIVPVSSVKLSPTIPKIFGHNLSPLPPRERFSVHLLWTAAPPPRTTPIAGPGITTRAPDPAIPLPFPRLGRPSSERVSLEDPTADKQHSFLLAQTPAVALPPPQFQKTAIPDPFEFGEQIRPQLPATLEPGRYPAAAPPPRPILH